MVYCMGLRGRVIVLLSKSILLSLAITCVSLWLVGCNLNSAAITPTAAPTPDVPQVLFNAPVNNARVFEETLLDVDIVATDNTQGIAKIEFYVDGTLLETGEPEVSPAKPVFRVTMNWLTEGVGTHTFSAIAYRPDGTTSEESIMVIEVVPRAG
jgi:hypothetical protein